MKLPENIEEEKPGLSHEVSIKENDKFDGYASFSNLEYLTEDYKAKAKYVKYLERLIRGSLELKAYLSFLKENAEMNDCAIFAGVNREDCRIEIHHFPFSLFDITRIVLDDALANNEDVSSFAIVSRVVLEHFLGNVGLIPLSLTAHELAHSGSITLSLKNVTGNWQNFVKKFGYVMTKDDIERLKFLVNASTSESLNNTNMRKLKIVPRQIKIIKQISNGESNATVVKESLAEAERTESSESSSSFQEQLSPEVWAEQGA